MEILQNDIFGNKQLVSEVKEKKSSSTPAKQREYRDVSISDGLDSVRAENESMLILRILQKKIMYSGISSKVQKDKLLKIIQNEADIKLGITDPITSVRSSLLEFFVQKK